MSPNSLSKVLRIFCAVAFLFFGVAVQRTLASDHVFTGTITKVDTGAKTVAVKAKDGTIHTVKWTDDTTVTGLKGGAHGADLAGKEGGHVIVHTTGEGADETARSFDYVGHRTVHVADVTVDDVGEGSKSVAVHTADGTKDTLHVGDHATVDTGKGIEKGGHYTVYYTEDAGKKVAHFFGRL
ncbi:MAG TPA: hypothetical protein VMU43_13175 [Candidatus Acidoferrum sp.]|nr:hypothetical protein [Candidatus Acidoferrum sp.]